MTDIDKISESGKKLSRRKVLAALAGTGIGTLTFQRALAAQASKQGGVSSEMIQQSEWIAGIELSTKIERQPPKPSVGKSEVLAS